MVEKIIVQPEKVRGGGNIVSPPKTVTDFSLYNSRLSLTDNVYTLRHGENPIAVSLSANPLTVNVGDSVTFTAIVTENDEPLEGVTVSFKEGSTVIGTGETDSTGTATLVKSDFSEGCHYVVASYSTGVSSVVTVGVTRLSVTLTGTKSILSYADGESSVLTARVLDDADLGVEGATVNLYKNGVLWDTLVTNWDGTVSKTYSSAGVGDVSFTAEVGSLVSETYSLEDCIYYHDMTSADSTHWTIPSNVNASYSSSGMKFQPTSFIDAYLEIPLTKPYSVEFDLIQYSGNPTYLHYLWDSAKSTRHIYMGLSSGKTVLDTYPNSSNYWNGYIPQGSHVKIEINDDNVKLYANDELKLTKSYSMPSSSILGLAGSSNTTCTWKNIKIKPL